MNGGVPLQAKPGPLPSLRYCVERKRRLPQVRIQTQINLRKAYTQTERQAKICLSFLVFGQTIRSRDAILLTLWKIVSII